MAYSPPFTITSEILSLVARISEHLGNLSASINNKQALLLRKVNQVRTIHGSLAIEGNQLSEAQITAILDGKRVIAPVREVQEASNALAVYEQLDNWHYKKQSSLLAAHKALMLGLIDSAGKYRSGGVGVVKAKKVIHMAPPADQVSRLMNDLFSWLSNTKEHPLIASCIFHYEFEYIHPFADGNGRMGRLWQSLILTQHHSVFAYLPVESLIYKHQKQYYKALSDSTVAVDCAPFISFMLLMIEQSLHGLLIAHQVSPQDDHQVSPQVNRLVLAMQGQFNEQGVSVFSREALQSLLSLSDRKSFNLRYIKPALVQGLIEMTIPDKPRSRSQQYRLTGLANNN